MTDQLPDVVDHNTDQPTDHESATDQRPTDQTPLSLEEAADRLGITVNAVRQRIKRGTVHGQKTAAGWVVFLSTNHATTLDPGRRPTDQPTSMSRPATNRPSDQTVIAPLAELIADLSRQNQELAATAALWQERARFLGEQLRALEAGPVVGDVDQDAQERPQERDTGTLRGDDAVRPSQASVPAWRRWWRRITRGE